LLGQEEGTFLWDHLGVSSVNEWGVVADSSLAKRGYAIGSSVSLVGFSETFTIESFVDGATYQTLPLLYAKLSSWRQLRFAGASETAFSSGVAAKGLSIEVPSSLKAYSLKQYYGSLPGYSAQVATFSLMISFLVAIASFILGVFMYVLTLQKTSLFGVMKAQGVASSYLAMSVIYQTLLLIVPGCLTGFGLTALSVAFLGDKLPFAYNSWFNLAIIGAFIGFSLIGALFLVRTVLRIDPVKAI
jgi:putative ABC transport system permease protein